MYLKKRQLLKWLRLILLYAVTLCVLMFTNNLPAFFLRIQMRLLQYFALQLTVRQSTRLGIEPLAELITWSVKYCSLPSVERPVWVECGSLLCLKWPSLSVELAYIHIGMYYLRLRYKQCLVVVTIHSIHTTYPVSFSLGLAQHIVPYLNEPLLKR